MTSKAKTFSSGTFKAKPFAVATFLAAMTFFVLGSWYLADLCSGSPHGTARTVPPQTTNAIWPKDRSIFPSVGERFVQRDIREGR